MITLREEKGTQLTHQEMDENFKSVMGGHNFLHIQDQKPQDTHGGTFTSGAWQTRDLNTVLTNTISGASLAANQITLPAGKYYVEASAPFMITQYAPGIVQARIYNFTDTSVVFLSAPSYGNLPATSSFVSHSSEMSGSFMLSATKQLQIEHRCGSTVSNNGFGFRSDYDIGIYSDIRIWRIGEYVAP